jgi:hypothetical protein
MTIQQQKKQYSKQYEPRPLRNKIDTSKLYAQYTKEQNEAAIQGSGKKISKENELEPKTEAKETQKLAKDAGKAEGFEWNNESNLDDLVG